MDAKYPEETSENTLNNFKDKVKKDNEKQPQTNLKS